MNIPHNLTRIIAGALLSSAVTVAGLAIAPGTAQADPQSQGPLQWCPGQRLPQQSLGWNMSVCHTYWQTPFGRGNVPLTNGGNSEIWEGPNPPPYWEPVCAPFVPPVNCRPPN